MLKDEMVTSGSYFFRWRSFLPLLFLPVVVVALVHFTYLGGSEAVDNVWEAFCVAVSMFGLALRVFTVGSVPAHTSGRNTRQQEATSLNMTGMYSIVRHPLYLGNYFIWLGVTLFPHAWWLVVIMTLAFFLYYERMMLAEEEFLRATFAHEFEEWASRTPAFIPAFLQWVPSDLPFRWKPVLARENSTFFATVVTFFVLEVAGDYFAGVMPHVDRGWIVLLCAGVVVYTVLRWLKRHDLLAVKGR